MVTRISTLAQSLQLRTIISRTQDRLLDSQLKISTQQKSQNYMGIAADSSRLVSLEASRRKIDQFQSNNTFLTLRMQTMLNSVDKIRESIKDIRNLYREILDDGKIPSGINKDDLADIKMAEVQDFLNVKINGRFLFAGSKTNVKPVQPGTLSSAPADTGTPNFTTSAEPSFYYQGDDTTLKARIDESVEVNYGVTAAHTGFEKMIRSIRILRSTNIDGAVDPDFLTKIQNGKDLLDSADAALADLELTIGTRLQQVNTTSDKQRNLANFFDSIISKIESADTVEAVARLNQDSAMLEASFKVIVRMGRLTLTNFI